MAISNSGLTNTHLANTVQNQVQQASNLTNKTTATVSDLAQGAEQVKAVANGLTSLFSLLQQGETEQGNKKPEGKQDDKFIKTFQSALLGSLGADTKGDKSIDEQLKSLTSEASIETLQAAFLTSLQQSLFTPKNNKAESKEQGESTEKKQPAKELTPLQSLEKLSFGKDGLEINDGFDAVNILNHVPVVSEVYKNVTGHDISGLSKLAGGYLYGGPTGLMFSAIELTTQSLFGNSLSGMLAEVDYGQLFNSDQQKDEAKVSSTASKSESDLTKSEPEVAVVEWRNSTIKPTGVTAK